MRERQPEDAVPAEFQPAAPPAKPSLEERIAHTRWRNFRTSGKIVGVRISEDGTEVWSHGFGKPHYPIADSKATVESAGAVIVFRAPTYELAIDVPKAARKYARRFAADFNTWMMNGAVVPPAV